MVYARMMSVSNTTTICLSTKHLSMYLKLFPFGIIIISMFSLLYINFPTDATVGPRSLFTTICMFTLKRLLSKLF